MSFRNTGLLKTWSYQIKTLEGDITSNYKSLYLWYDSIFSVLGNGISSAVSWKIMFKRDKHTSTHREQFTNIMYNIEMGNKPSQLNNGFYIAKANIAIKTTVYIY